MGETEQGTEEESLEEGTISDEFLTPNDEDFDEELLHETVEDTVIRTRKAQKDQEPSNEEAQKGSEGFDNKQAQAKDQQVQKPSEEILEAPQRLSPEAREWFKGAPAEAKHELVKIVRDLENGQRNAIRQIHEVKTDAETIVSHIGPFAKDWAAKGITVARGVALLAQTHEKMLANPAAAIAELIQDNGITIDDVDDVLQGVSTGATPSNSNRTNGNVDLASIPEFKALQDQNNYLINKYREDQIKAETDQIKALAQETDANGSMPFQHILNPAFLKYASVERVSERRTPPRGDDGRFIGPPKSLTEAYKELYQEWLSEVQAAFPSPVTASQPLVTQSPKKRNSEPLSMRSRNSSMNRPSVSMSDDPERFKFETVEETVARLNRMRG